MRGSVLHTDDYHTESGTVDIVDNVCKTVTMDILRDIASGKEAKPSLQALGYAGWGEGQLETRLFIMAG